MKDRKGLYVILLAAGVVTFCAGALLMKNGASKELSGALIGVGAGLFGMSAGQLINLIIIAKNPDLKRKTAIEAKDERTIYINNLAKGKVFDAWGAILGILLLVFVLMDSSLTFILLLVGAYLCGWVIYLGYMFKYSKEM